APGNMLHAQMQQGDPVVKGQGDIGHHCRDQGEQIMRRRDGAEGGDELRAERLALELAIQQPERSQDSKESERGPDVIEVAFDEVHPGPARSDGGEHFPRPLPPPLLHEGAQRKLDVDLGLWSRGDRVQEARAPRKTAISITSRVRSLSAGAFSRPSSTCALASSSLAWSNKARASSSWPFSSSDECIRLSRRVRAARA